jgi:hypothetical protein
MDAALRLPPQGLDPHLLAAAGLEGRGRVLLLPAFLHFLLRLQSSYPPGRFALQFRTFGDDLPRVAREFNALCRGQHPLFPDQCFGGGGGGGGGIDHSLDLDGDGECFGCMYRDEEGPALILGTFEQPGSRGELAGYRRRGHRVMESVQVGFDVLLYFTMTRMGGRDPRQEGSIDRSVGRSLEKENGGSVTPPPSHLTE